MNHRRLVRKKSIGIRHKSGTIAGLTGFHQRHFVITDKPEGASTDDSGCQSTQVRPSTFQRLTRTRRRRRAFVWLDYTTGGLREGVELSLQFKTTVPGLCCDEPIRLLTRGDSAGQLVLES